MKTRSISVFAFFLLAFSIHAQENIPGSQAETTSPFADIKLFPNPTSEILFIRNGDLVESYLVIDMQGRIMQTGQHNAQVISLIDVPVGYYFIEMRIGDAVERIRVQKY